MNLFDLCVYKNLNKGSGGDVDVSSLVATENKTYNAGEGKAYNPVVVNVPTPSPSLQSLTASHNGYFVPSSGYDGFSEVTVDVATPLETLSATENGTYIPSSGYEGFSEVTVDVPLPNNAYLLESQKNDVVTIQHGAEFDMPKLIASIEPQQSGSGDPSPENVRPISGWTACNVTRCGVNVWDEEWELGDINNQGQPVPNNNLFRCKNFVPIKPQTSYYFKSTLNGNNDVFYYDKDKNFLQLARSSTIKNQVFTTPENAYYLKFYNSTVTTYSGGISINYPNTDHDYHAYSGDTYTINFVDGSNPLTVYGGTLDVLSGVLKDVFKNGIINIGEQSFAYNSTLKTFYLRLFNSKEYTSAEVANAVSSAFKCVANNAMSDLTLDNCFSIHEEAGSIWLNIRCLAYSDATNFANAMSGQILMYEVASPTTIQLTPTEVKSLLGVNNIWADTGEVDVQIWTKEVTL